MRLNFVPNIVCFVPNNKVRKNYGINIATSDYSYHGIITVHAFSSIIFGAALSKRLVDDSESPYREYKFLMSIFYSFMHLLGIELRFACYKKAKIIIRSKGNTNYNH